MASWASLESDLWQEGFWSPPPVLHGWRAGQDRPPSAAAVQPFLHQPEGPEMTVAARCMIALVKAPPLPRGVLGAGWG